MYEQLGMNQNYISEVSVIYTEISNYHDNRMRGGLAERCGVTQNL